jgi:tripartite-type tricarboxylate transporter receptor subunit TctC
VATFKEKGLRQTFLNNWVGLFAPAGVPPSVVEILIQGSEKAVRSKEFVESIEKTGSIVEPMTRAEYEKALEDERKVGDTIAHELGLKKSK